ncbi:hypothetical protein A2U01_0114344, partial [Trifolium medium]|nr:hypothetical protein [Trifolium medium]
MAERFWLESEKARRAQ